MLDLVIRVSCIILGRVALGAQRPTMIRLSRGRYVGLSVSRSVQCPVHCRKTADRIRMPFGVIGRTSPGMRQVVGFGGRSTRRGTSGGEFGARHCNQWGRYGVRVRQCLNRRSCGLGWCVRHCCIRWGSASCMGRGRFGVFVPHFHNGKCHWVDDGEMFLIRMRKLNNISVRQTYC